MDFVFSTMRHFSKTNSKNFKFFKKNVLRFLSFKYSADLGRSRLVRGRVKETLETFQPQRFEKDQ